MDDKLLAIFAEESLEILDSMEKGLLDLEGSEDQEVINSVFRAAHTMKGNAGIVGFDIVVDFTHLMEGILDEMRQGRMKPDADAVGLLLSALDELKVLVEETLAGKSPNRPEELMSAMNQRLGQESAPAQRPDAAPAAKNGPGELFQYHITLRLGRDLFTTGTDPLLLLLELSDLGSVDKVVCHDDQLPDFDQMTPDHLYLWWEVWLSSREFKSAIENVFIFVQDGSDIIVEQINGAPGGGKTGGAPQAAGPAPAPPKVDEPPPPPHPPPPSAASPPQPPAPQGMKPAVAKPAPKTPLSAAHPPPVTPSIRVDTEKLDKLVNLVGELVIGVARVNQLADQEQGSAEELGSAVEALDHISRDLQENVMTVRMIPVEGTFNRFQRVVRDLAAELGKKIRLEMSGTETELDKNVIEQIADPLKHLIRNSADHGLEPPEERLSGGKPETGTIWLRAYQQEGKIIIEVADDGRGIDKNKVYQKIIQKGLADPSAALNENEIFSYMFQPGFSTAAKVTEVSGRGVGLDVVRQNIEALKGSVEVETKPGQGSVFRVKLPLTLAIIDGMMVRVGQETLTLPLLSILESIRPKADEIKTVEGKGELIAVRDQYLPLVRLHEVFGFPTERTDPTKALVVIIESVNKQFGVLVDDILGEQQAVIKSLEENYRKVEGVAGATILGDGTVSLILDIHGLEKMAFSQPAAQRGPETQPGL